MLLNFAEFNALDRVCLQHASNEVFAIGWDLHWHAIVALLDFHEEHCELLVVKW